MRVTRIITAIVAFALMGLLPLASSATAAPVSEKAITTQSAAKAPSARAGRSIGTKIVKKNGKLIMLGNVKPPKGPVVIQKATSCNVKKGVCNFKFYKSVPVKKGRYKVRVYAPTKGSWAWRARVGATVGDIWVTCKRRTSTSPCPTP